MTNAIKHGVDRSPPSSYLQIDGEELATGTGGTFVHVSSVTGMPQAQVPLAGVSEIDLAVAAAKRAFPSWRATPGSERRRLLNKLADLIENHAEEFSRLAAIEIGAPVAMGQPTCFAACEWTRYYGGWADKIEGQVVSSYPAGDFAYVCPEPYGVIGLIVTWNGPLISICMKAPAALAAGNTIVVKPSEIAPFSANLFAKLVKEAGFPNGVVNVLAGGAQAGERLVRHVDVDKVSFTGGPVSGAKVMHACADSLKPVVMELGGKAPNIIFPDVDLETVAAHAVYNSLGIQSGQGCGLPTRAIIHANIYRPLLEMIAAIVEKLPIGDPFDMGTVVGPLVNEAAAVRVLGLIERARMSNTMRVLSGGARLGGSFAAGAYIEPTVFADVDAGDPLAQNEVFGPVLTLHSFRSEEEAVRIANATRYGLGGYVHTNDLTRAHRVAAQLKTGNVWINGAGLLAPQHPFGGAGGSGFGREGGKAGLDEFLRHKAIALAR